MIKRFLLLFFLSLTISLQACGIRAVVFPKDDYIAPSVVDSQVGSAPETINFYIQGTEFMRGFTVDNLYRKVPRILYDSAQELWRGSEKFYFRFDYITHHIPNDYPGYDETRYEEDPVFAYWLNENDFISESVAQGEFYSYKWMAAQEGKHPERYIREADNGEKIYLRKDTEHFDPNYLQQTIKQLDKESLSVVITDLTDSGFDDTMTLIATFDSYLDSGDKKAISIIQIVSKFDGDIYIPNYVLKDETFQRNTAESLKSAAWPYKGNRPFYILVFGDEEINTVYCSKLKESINGDNVNYLLMTSMSNGLKRITKQMDILEGSEEGLINVITSGSFDKEEKKNLDARKNDYLYYYFFNGAENGKLTIKTPLPENGVDDFSNLIRARIVLSGIREGEKNVYQEILAPAAAVYTDQPVVNGRDILTGINLSKKGLEDVSLSSSVPKVRAIVELYADLNEYDVVKTIKTYSTSRTNAQAMGKDDETLIKYYGAGTISLDNIVNALWERYKVQTDSRVGYAIIYIRAGK